MVHVVVISGDFEDAESATMKVVLSWMYKSFSRGEESLFSKLVQIDGGQVMAE